ncbi:MAG TPA: hypothetical protein VFT50_00475 [Baekduia sp.]|nr:hypothetical protein [Baekduia sp.]
MRRLVLLLPVLVIAALAAALPATGAPIAPPTVQTKPAVDINGTEATLTALVDPKGSDTTVHFEIGTDATYGLQSSSQDVPAGSEPVTVKIPVQGLTSSTTYHFRAVAKSAGGTARGADATFVTARQSTTPRVAGTKAQDISLSGATLVSIITPRGAETTYHFEYGRDQTYGATTPETSAGDGWDAVPVNARIEGLEPGKSYHFRLVTTNANGTARSIDHKFVVLGTPSAASLAASKYRVPYGGAVRLTGRLAGSKRGGVRVRLQITTFPFDQPFADIATATSSSRGTYRFTLPDLQATTRAVIIAPGMPDILSPIISVQVAVRTQLTSVRVTRRRVIVHGAILPAIPTATASLQRLASNGRWLPVARRHVRSDGSYRIRARRWRAGGELRVVGVAHDQGGHVSAPSRIATVPSMKPRHRHHHHRRHRR